MEAQNSAGVLTGMGKKGFRGRLVVLLIGAISLLVAGAVVVALVSGKSESSTLEKGSNTPPTNLDTSWTQTSAKGLYRGTVTPNLDPIEINQLHSWKLHIETADGRPVDDATVTIHGDMPGHGHGLPTEPAVTQKLGNGDYLVEGMKFQMTGLWYVEFGIASGGNSDTLRFDFTLE